MDHVEARQAGFEAREEREASAKTITTGSVIEAVGGIGVVVLTILGLVGVVPEILASVAAIAFGVALAGEGVAVASRFHDLARAEGAAEKAEIGGGSGSELLGGLAGGVLGLLALLGIVPVTLLAVASIVFGASLLLGSASTARLSSAMATNRHPIAQDSVVTAVGAQLLVGIAAVALGIIALTGIVPMTLVLISLLSLGSAALISGSAVGGAIVSVFS
ncbi:MAG TPA: hypothetical protein VE131_14070 [Terriglobales bacterium]|nr:hypothetical protein [Terriglobales bacterium]